MKSFDLHLYAVTDAGLSANIPVEKQVEYAILGGVTFVQLREKNLGFQEYAAKGRRVKAVCDKYGIPFVVNDNVEVAKAIGSGVHIGQSDMEIRNARVLLGNDKIIGVSANTVAQAIQAEKAGADYIGIGSIFATDTKTDVEIIGVNGLAEIATAIDIPTVAIGGIKADNASLLACTGVDGIAVVSAIFGANDITNAAKELCCWKEK